MKYYALPLLLVLSTGPCYAAPVQYNLSQASLFNNLSDTTQLSGSLSIDYPLGLPPVGNLAYKFNNLDLAENNTPISFTGFNFDFFPAVVNWPTDIALNPDLSINNLSQVYLGITQTGSGNNYYQYSEEYLLPVLATDTAHNNLTFGAGSSFPSSMLLTYELHAVSSRADKITYPPGMIGPLWNYSVVSDNLLGTLTINADASPVPLPTSVWLFTSAILGFVPFLKTKPTQRRLG